LAPFVYPLPSRTGPHSVGTDDLAPGTLLITAAITNPWYGETAEPGGTGQDVGLLELLRRTLDELQQPGGRRRRRR